MPTQNQDSMRESRSSLAEYRSTCKNALGAYPSLLKPSGRMVDMLFGQVAVVFGDAEFMSAPP
jgi:hypothetical protein